MAKLKYSKTLYKLRKQPELPDWYRYLQIFIGVVVAIAFLLHLISPSKHANTVNLVTNTITSSGVNTYKPTPVNSNNNQENSNSTTNSSKTTLTTLSGTSVEVLSEQLSLAKEVALAKYTGNWDKVIFSPGESVTNQQTNLKPAIGKVYVADSTANSISFLVVVIKDPVRNAKLGVQLTINLTFNDGRWGFNPNSNAGL